MVVSIEDTVAVIISVRTAICFFEAVSVFGVRGAFVIGIKDAVIV